MKVFLVLFVFLLSISLALIKLLNGKSPPRIVAAAAAGSALVTLFLTTTSGGGAQGGIGATISSYQGRKPTDKYWPGWDGITHMFVFGDSYSMIGFDSNGAQPGEENPLGNPAYPGYTSVNGPNWVDFLTSTYNDSHVRAIDLAAGGAMVDASLVVPVSPGILTVKDQIQNVYLPKYGASKRHKDFLWMPHNTLFAIFIGINDIVGAVTDQPTPDVLERVIQEYAALVDRLYQTGAKNFLFFTVPPIDRSPLVPLFEALARPARAPMQKCVPAFNANITAMAANLTASYPDAWAHVFDTHKLFTHIMDVPCSHPETCAYKETTQVCEAYKHGTAGDWYFHNLDCPYPVDQYFWLDVLHPTFRVMNVTAQELAKELRAQGPKGSIP